MLILLMLLTVLAAGLLLIVLVRNLNQIMECIYRIGGDPDSYLSKLRWGLGAIEKETGHLPTEVTALNETLGAIAEGLTGVDEHLTKTIDAVIKQEKK